MLLDRTATIDELTPRQLEILRLVANHYERKEIARQLDLTESGVKFHIDTIRKRLGVTSSKQAVRLFVEYEAQNDPAFSGQYPKETVVETDNDDAVSAHEHALRSERRLYVDHVERPGDGMAQIRAPVAGAPDRGLSSDLEDPQPHTGREGSSLLAGDDNGLSDIGRWRAFTGRLIGLFVGRSLVNTLTTAVILIFLFVAIVAGTAATMRAIQDLTGQTR